MVQVCETMTCEPEGASACIPMSIFEPLYLLIAELNCPEHPGIGPTIEDEITKPLLEHLRAVADEQAGNITPRNLAHFNCPKLY
jgi:hypothetical protein